MTRLRQGGAGLAAGVLIALSLPPWGWWPLAWLGVALLAWLLEGQPWRRRALIGEAAGLGVFAIGLFWMSEFSAPGFVLAAVVEGAFVAVAAVATRRVWTLPAALVLAELARAHLPFGGVPLGGMVLGQVGGPLAPAARLGGELLVIACATAAGAAMALAARHRRAAAAGLAIFVIAAPGLGALCRPGRVTGHVRVALVQGGGRRGYTSLDASAVDAFPRALRANEGVRPPVDLVLWPEDVIDVPRLAGSAEERTVAALARRLGATTVVGIVEDAGTQHFHNAAVAWDPAGRIVDRYEKVHRVPFGEYVPARGLVKHLADLSAVPRDALPGHKPNVLRTPAGRFGVLVSYEVFFERRARVAARHGAQLILVPTNASSFRTSQVPGQELATARLRAIQTGRDVLQAAPTGYTAVVDALGRVKARSRLGTARVLQADVPLRSGRTPAVRFGNPPLIAIAIATLLVPGRSWGGRRRPGRSRATPQRRRP